MAKPFMAHTVQLQHGPTHSFSTFSGLHFFFSLEGEMDRKDIFQAPFKCTTVGSDKHQNLFVGWVEISVFLNEQMPASSPYRCDIP